MALEGPSNDELRPTLAISEDEARNGTTRVLTLAGGRQVTVTVPAGAYSGQELRLPGQGSATSYDPRGSDLVLIINIIATEANRAQPSTNQQEIETLFIPPPPSMQPPFASSPSYPGITTQNQPVTNYPYPTPSMQATPYPNINTNQQPIYAPYQQPVAASPYPTPARRSSVMTVMLIVLTALVIGGGILIYYRSVYVPQQQQLQATATVVAKATGTADAYATSTVQAQATVSAQVTATAQVANARQGQYDQITLRTPKLNDPLTGPGANNWIVADGCNFVNNAYHLVEDKQGFFLTCTGSANNFANFAFQVKMTILKGDFGGLLFRSDTNITKFYYFHISTNGNYDFYYYPDNSGKTSQTLLTGTTSLIHAGLNQENLIAVIAQDNDLNLYVNGKYLDSTSYNGPTAGIIGVVADDSTHPTEVVYSQAQVWVL
ncbi:MAG: hypothetical protein E6J34_07510 [Chloroflexi bacterium]|nr:MAG: hypothetical protein E6J34_07510 [Chloroflexota bacterium]